jgi:hypothetical protein
LFVLGFDIPVEEAQFFDSYYAKAKVLTDSIGIDLIPLQFNFRKIIVDWEMSHCTGLASCLHLFSGLFSIGLIASSHAYDSLRFPWGSNPLTDPLLSSDRLRIINDGGECRRWEKAAVVAGWEEAMKHLRVCYEGKQRDRNCGACSNCLLTAIGFAAAGKTPPPALNIRTIKGAVWQLFALPLKPMGVVRINQMITFAEEHNTTAPWLTLLRICSRFHKMRLKVLPPLRKLRRLSKALKQKLCGAMPVKLPIS